MYYKCNDFEVFLHLSEATHVTDWLRTIVRCCGNDPFRNFGFYMLRSPWEDLELARPLTKFFMEIEVVFRPLIFEFTPDRLFSPQLAAEYRDLHDQSEQSLFHLAGDLNCAFKHVLEEAVVLGQRARTENWHEEWLEVEFGLWIEEKMSRNGGVAHRAITRNEKQKARRVAYRMQRDRS